MFVAVARFTLVLADSHSLKDKRSVIRKVKARVQQRFHLELDEVAEQDLWQRADLAFSLVSLGRDQAAGAAASVLAFVSELGLGELAKHRLEVLGFGDDWYASATSERPTEPDAWVPDAWRADVAVDDGGKP